MMYVLCIITGSMLFGNTSAFASGYPIAIITSCSLNSSQPSIVLGDFASGSGQFTQAEAQNLTTPITTAIQQALGNSGSSMTVTVLSPDQLTANDADTWKTIVYSNYKSWGFNTYTYVYISKSSVYATGFGPNIRLDFNVADKASLVNVKSAYLYLSSVEFPYMYLLLPNIP